MIKSSSSSDAGDYSDGGDVSSSVAPSRRTAPQTRRSTRPAVDDTIPTPVKDGPSTQPENKPPGGEKEAPPAADHEKLKGLIVPAVAIPSKKAPPSEPPLKRT